MQGNQNNKKYGLYDIAFEIATDRDRPNEKIQGINRQQINIIVQVDKNKADLAQF